ncbi:HlyD family secretion protein [Coxiella endosymbiont of Amblyomma sculptum]|uniref:HlyD family secretion protein n=1 Tax=Coxiella endosymbiont of Amblyomma sculptum TaxID=2487929 RepID=UPI00132F47F7|nr:HlyD family secretion protein [Coxiella endosymbiont of Amblyomma sculptum]QHG92543.1 HlyD family secretion protein [Coxiella endosymbiont of Amblyomma sculptum]
MSKISKIVLPLLGITALFFIGFFYWKHKNRYPSTDDAYVQTNVIDISPQISGAVVKVYVHDHQHVRKGQPLFDIDPTPFTIDLIKANAQLNETKQKIRAADAAIQSARDLVSQKKAELARACLLIRRGLDLMEKQFFSCTDSCLIVRNLDIAKIALVAAQDRLQVLLKERGQIGGNNAQLQLAKATLEKSQLDLTYTHVVAPVDGFVAHFSLRQGDNISAYQSLFALIEDQTWWATANFKETQIANIHPGQSATITIDMYPGQVFLGRVESISVSSETSFSLLPSENASGNWVKAIQRFPIKVVIVERNPTCPFRLGASSTVTIDTAQ